MSVKFQITLLERFMAELKAAARKGDQHAREEMESALAMLE